MNQFSLLKNLKLSKSFAKSFSYRKPQDVISTTNLSQQNSTNKQALDNHTFEWFQSRSNHKTRAVFLSSTAILKLQQRQTNTILFGSVHARFMSTTPTSSNISTNISNNSTVIPPPPPDVDVLPTSEQILSSLERLAATAPSPAPAEPALPYLDWSIFHPFETALHWMHETTGSPWWLTIVAFTTILRIGFLPLGAIMVTNSHRINAMQPEMAAIQKKQQRALEQGY